MKQPILAWQRQPEPNGTLFAAADLATAAAVEQLFGHCHRSGAYITAEGWQFLFATYGLQQLVQVAAKSGFTGSEEGKTLAHLVYQSLLAGYDPLSRQMGDYDTETAEFIAHSGTVSKIDWKSVGG